MFFKSFWLSLCGYIFSACLQPLLRRPCSGIQKALYESKKPLAIQKMVPKTSNDKQFSLIFLASNERRAQDKRMRICLALILNFVLFPC
jgi:hypothetical protein